MYVPCNYVLILIKHRFIKFNEPHANSIEWGDKLVEQEEHVLTFNLKNDYCSLQLCNSFDLNIVFQITIPLYS